MHYTKIKTQKESSGFKISHGLRQNLSMRAYTVLPARLAAMDICFSLVGAKERALASSDRV